MPAEDALRAVRATGLTIVPFGPEHLEAIPQTVTGQQRHRGLSFRDRACLATRLVAKAPVVTAWRNWKDGREVSPDANPTWFGYSAGKWEGDT